MIFKEKNNIFVIRFVYAFCNWKVKINNIYLKLLLIQAKM